MTQQTRAADRASDARDPGDIQPAEQSARHAEDDPDRPVGIAPPTPGWHVPLAAVAWGLWLAFLIGMLVVRVTHA